MSDEQAKLPSVALTVIGDTFHAAGEEPVKWSIYAEPERDDKSARTRIEVDGNVLADVTIHATTAGLLTDEVQAVGAALVWSGIRAWAWRSEINEGG